MAIARKFIMDKDRPGFYLITNRCVRQLYNLGKGPDEKQKFERKLFMEELLLLLCCVFMVRLITFSFMENHYHLELFFNPKRVKKLSDEEVAHLVLKLDVKSPQRSEWNEAQRKTWIQAFIKDRSKVRQWRKNLSDPSKFMAYFNEVTARHFNKEDGCKGHFWQGRFHSVQLEDSGAVLMSTSYIDLNPVRAKACDSLLKSSHTGISYRLTAALPPDENAAKFQRSWLINKSLCPVRDWFNESDWEGGTPRIEFIEYVKLLEDLGLMCSEGRGTLNEESLGIMARFNLNEQAAQEFPQLRKLIHHVLGSPGNMRVGARNRGRRWHQGVGNTKGIYLSATQS